MYYNKYYKNPFNPKSALEKKYKQMKKIFYILSFSVLLFACNEHKVTSIEIFGKKVRILDVGQKDTLELIVNPLDSYIHNPVEWRSSDESVAVVGSRSGIVTAVYSGVCTITAFVGNHIATCEIRVNTIDLDFSFSKAVASFWGEEYGTNNCVLRLLSDGYNLQPDGSITGAGYFFDIDLWYNPSDIFPPNGLYTPFNETPIPFSFSVGDTVRENGSLYPVGTYFLQSTLSGNSAILIKNGNFKIQNDTIKGNFIGGNGEKIAISYSGDVIFIDRTLPPPDTLKLNNSVQSYALVGDMFGNGTNVRRCIIYSKDQLGTYLQLDFAVPISAYSIPIGFYRLNNSHLPYSLVESDLENGAGTILFENSTTPKEVLDGNVNVQIVEGKLKFTIYLVEESGRVIIGEVSCDF